MSEQKTVLVTGGSGFLGGHCVSGLLDRGHRVRATVRDPAREASVRSAVAADPERSSRLEFAVADLSADAGWAEAVAGCDHVIHVASPFPESRPKDPDELIVPARDGALRVIGAALAADVERIVMTSSVAAMRYKPVQEEPYDESDWTDPDLPGVPPYPRSKTIAERAAWDLVEREGAVGRLTVVNPSAILGPVQGEETSFSLQVIQRMIDGMPGVPRLGFSWVDVRDCAEMHILALTSNAARGERFIASGPFHWLVEIAAMLRAELPEIGAKAPTREIPKTLVRLMAIFDPSVRAIVDDIGERRDFTAAKAERALGWKARPIEETVRDCALSLSRRKADR